MTEAGKGRDPETQDDTEFQYYVQQNGIKSNWQHPSEAELIRSVNKLHTFTRQLVVEKGQIQNALLDAQSKLRFSRGWIWVLTLAMASSWGLIGGMVKLWLLPILEKVPR
jgi:hypothetical protein